MALTREEAEELAIQALLAAGKRGDREEIRFDAKRTIRRPYGFVFSYFGKSFAETGDILDIHGWETPVVVLDDGRVEILSGEHAPARSLAEFELNFQG